jgi:hypothetical protein
MRELLLLVGLAAIAYAHRSALKADLAKVEAELKAEIAKLKL